MIRIKLFGGARKSFLSDEITIAGDGITIADILEYLVQNKPEGTADLDTANVLIAVNGADSSALGGRDAVVNSGDVVSVIPVIHGGSRIRFMIGSRPVEILEVRGKEEFDHTYIDDLRERHRRLALQGVSSAFVLGISHVQKVLYLSLRSQRYGALLAKRLEADILARFACTTQISRAIAGAGISSGRDFVLIAVGPAAGLDRLHSDVKPFLAPNPFQNANPEFLKREFQITQEHLQAVDSDTPLEDVLVERAATLF